LANFARNLRRCDSKSSFYSGIIPKAANPITDNEFQTDHSQLTFAVALFEDGDIVGACPLPVEQPLQVASHPADKLKFPFKPAM
jgi:hypothetical protein